MKKNEIIITGGCGFIGTNIALLAIKKGYHVTVFDSLIRPMTEENASILSKKGAEIIRGDVRNQHDLEKLPKNAVGIIHLAANPGIQWSIASPVYDFTVNALGTMNVLEFSRNNGKIPVIYASTNKVYSEEINLVPTQKKKTRYQWKFSKEFKLPKRISLGISDHGVNENFPIDSAGTFPHSPYGISKLTGDLYCQEYYQIYAVPTVINRMSCAYGLYQKGVEDQGWIDWFVRAKIFGYPLTIYGDGKQVRDALFGQDLAKLYLGQLEKIHKVKGEVFNIGGGPEHTTSLLEMIEFLNRKGGKKLKIVYKPWRTADQRIYISDISKVKKLLGWEPKVGIFKGVEMMWKYYTGEKK